MALYSGNLTKEDPGALERGKLELGRWTSTNPALDVGQTSDTSDQVGDLRSTTCFLWFLTKLSENSTLGVAFSMGWVVYSEQKK